MRYVLILKARAKRMKKLVPPIITKSFRNPALIEIQSKLLANLSVSTNLFSPCEELFDFIQRVGYLMFYNMGSLRYGCM